MISLFNKTPNFKFITLHKKIKYRRFQRTCKQFSEHCLCITLENSSTCMTLSVINPLSANFTKWSNTLKQFVGKLPTNCLRVFDHFVGLALKGLIVPNKIVKKINYEFTHSFTFPGKSLKK